MFIVSFGENSNETRTRFNGLHIKMIHLGTDNFTLRFVSEFEIVRLALMSTIKP